MSLYGRLVSAPTIERGVEVCLRYFLGPYLGEVLEQAGHGRGDLPDPSDLTRMSEFDWPTESNVAVVVVATPGTEGDAEREAETYTLTWDVRAAVLADVGDALHSREASQFYAAAAGTALAHQGVAVVASDLRTWARGPASELLTLEGSSVRFRGERYRQLGRRDDRALIAGEALLSVTVQDARSAHGGPELPPAEPGGVGDGPRPSAPDIAPAPVDPSVTIAREPPSEDM